MVANKQQPYYVHLTGFDITPSLIRDEDKILAIRNQAVFARPAAGPDQSRFAIPSAELFE